MHKGHSALAQEMRSDPHMPATHKTKTKKVKREEKYYFLSRNTRTRTLRDNKKPIIHFFFLHALFMLPWQNTLKAEIKVRPMVTAKNYHSVPLYQLLQMKASCWYIYICILDCFACYRGFCTSLPAVAAWSKAWYILACFACYRGFCTSLSTVGARPGISLHALPATTEVSTWGINNLSGLGLRQVADRLAVRREKNMPEGTPPPSKKQRGGGGT